MKKLKTTEGGYEKVIFDQVDSTYVGGVHIDAEQAKGRFEDGVIPAGTAVLLPNEGDEAVLAVEGTDDKEGSLASVENIIGLTHWDAVIDDFPNVPIVQAGTVRKDALPDLEKASLEDIQGKLPRLSFY